MNHYSKSIFALGMLQKNDVQLISDQETYKKYEREIEIPVCLNLALSYLKLKEYQLVIKYATQVLEKEEDNDKALMTLPKGKTRT